MKSIELSIIIPAYNVEKYISRCLDSILMQRYSNYEIIIVDDASHDSTPTIIQEYAKKDDRLITVFFDINKGPSDARQHAIDMAHGVYIMFVDADDRYITDKALELMISAMKKTGVDCVSCRYIAYYSSRFCIKRGPKKGGSYMTNKEIAIEKLKKPRFYWHYLLNRCYKRDIIIDNNIKFKSDLLVTEDIKFNNDYMYYAKDYYFIDDYLYEYNCANENSITKTKYATSIESEKELFTKAKAQYTYHTKLYKDMNLYLNCQREIAIIMYIDSKRLLVSLKKDYYHDKLTKLIENDRDFIECVDILGSYTHYLNLKVINEFYLNHLKYYIKQIIKVIMP